jgi:hypothetical protein
VNTEKPSANDPVDETQTTVDEVESTTKPKRKRQKKTIESTMPIAPRIPHVLKIGAHVSAAKGIQNAISNAVNIGYSHLTRL